MKATLSVLATILSCATASYADPPASPASTRCAVTTPTGAFVATFDFATMTGTVTADGSVGTRRFVVKATPYAATYILMFQGYAPGDQKPVAEALTKGKSVVGRIVAFGDVNHLFLDGDYQPMPHAPMDGFVCK